jgi:DNA-binding beta-propeller fold protein YncE
MFDASSSICSDGNHVWVTNSLGDSITELTAQTGAFVQTLSGSTFGATGLDYVACDGAHVWVVSAEPNSQSGITELDASTGALVQVIQGTQYSFGAARDISSDGTHVWVTDLLDPAHETTAVTEIDASSGALVHVLSDPTYGFNNSWTISSDGTHVWVSNNSTVTEINASSGALVHVLPAADFPSGIVAVDSDGSHVWTANDSNSNGVTEIDASSGALVQQITGSSYGFDWPSAISSDGTNVWVVNFNNSVTEIDAVTGALVQVISGSTYGFNDHDGLSTISSDGTHVWTANFGGNTVTEMSANTGALTQLIGSNSYGIDYPFGVSSDGAHVWVANESGNSVSEIDAATGAIVQVLSASSYGFDYPYAIDSDGHHVWVKNEGSVSELDATTGALVRVIPSSSEYDVPNAISSDGTHVWVTDQPNQAVTEIDASTGAIVQSIGSSAGVFGPMAVSSDGTHVWIADNDTGNGNYAVTELDASTGALVQVIPNLGAGLPDSLDSISSDGTHVWMTNNNIPNNKYSVTELDAATGAVVQVISGPSYGLGGPGAIDSDGSHVWITNYGNNNVTELDASSGALVQVLSGSSYGFNYPRGISSDGNDVWIANTHDNSIIELSGLPAQVVSFTSAAPTDAQVGGSPYTVAATGGASGNPVDFSVDPAATSVCSISGQSVNFIGAGTCTIDANQDAGKGYAAADQVQQSFVVGTQQISFTSAAPSDAQIDGDPYSVTASGGGSGNPVVFSIDPASTSVCSISGQTVSFTAPGRCTIDANQAGNSDYLAAPQEQQSFLVGDPPIIFTSTPPSGAVVRGPTYTVSATGAPSGVPVLFSSSTTAVCTVAGSVVSFVTAGTCTIDANQAGTAQYLPSTGAQSFQVSNLQAVTLCTNTTALVGAGFSCAITTTGSPLPLLKRTGKLPSGLTFVNNHNGSATISGTARAKMGGTYSVGIQAVFAGSSVTGTLNLTVDESPSVISRSSKAAHVGVAVAALIRTRGYPKPAIGVAGGALPNGVTLTDNGNGSAYLEGTPASGTAGTYLVTISASNGIGNAAQQTFTLIVRG